MDKDKEIDSADYFNWPRSNHTDKKITLISRLRKRLKKSKITSFDGSKFMVLLTLVLPLSGISKNDKDVALHVDYTSEGEYLEDSGEVSKMFFDLYIPEMCFYDVDFDLELSGKNISVNAYGIKKKNADKDCGDIIKIYEREKTVVFLSPGKYRLFINNELQDRRVYIK